MIVMFAAAAMQAGSSPSLPSSPATSVAPARLVVARKLVTLLQIEGTLDRLFVQLAPGFAQSVIGALATNNETKPTIERLLAAAPNNRDRMIAILSQEFLASVKQRYPALSKKIAQEYATAFTDAELAAITAFYSSGPGAKAIALQPQLQQHLSAYGQEIGRGAGAEAGERAFDRITKEMLPTPIVPKT